MVISRQLRTFLTLIRGSGQRTAKNIIVSIYLQASAFGENDLPEILFLKSVDRNNANSDERSQVWYRIIP